MAQTVITPVTVDLPNSLVQEIETTARRQQRSVSDVVHELILQGLPALPADVESELAAFANLSDDVLWLLAKSTLTKEEQAELAQLNSQAKQSPLTDEEEARQEELLNGYDRAMVRRAQAVLVLKARGVDLSESGRITKAMSRAYISPATRQFVAERAKHRCEYYQTQEAFVGMALEIEHIIPEVAEGSSGESNLCLACPPCNRHKGTRTNVANEETGDAVPLFHPRQQEWRAHFAWQQDGLYLVGLTPTGRATIAALQMNNPFVVRSRRTWIAAGWHPPQE